MQTFLPYPSFEKSAKVLDSKRLGKQRIEARQILYILRKTKGKKKTGWRNHPAVLMWKGYENALEAYLRTIIDEWEQRGYKNNIRARFFYQSKTETIVLSKFGGWEGRMPPWLGNKTYHRTHKLHLISKEPRRYSKIFHMKPQPYNRDYLWPVKKEK
jgi:hypothetical protein